MNGQLMKANLAADDARLLFAAGRYNGACARAYYAMFSAARAMLSHSGVAAADAKRHSTVWRQFSLHFGSDLVSRLPADRSISRAGEIRNVADYSDIVVTAGVAGSVMQSMEHLLALAEQHLASPAKASEP